MSTQASKIKSGERAGRKRAASKLSLSKLLGLIILIEGVALGLKAYDDRGKFEAAKLAETQREALAVSEYVSGKVGAVEQTLVLSYQAGWSPTQTSRAHPDLDTVVTLADALTATSGSRLRAGGETASALLAQKQRVGLSNEGDLVIVHDPGTGTPRLGLVPVSAWTPKAQPPRRFSLAHDANIDSNAPIKACSPIAGSSSFACIETALPGFSRQDAISLGAYALLLLGPALAIIGLFKLLERQRLDFEAYEGEATRAGRILKTVLSEAKAGFWSWDEKAGQIWLSEEAAALLGSLPSGFHDVEAILNLAHKDHRDTLRQSFSTLNERAYLSQVFANHDKSVWFDLRAKPDEATGELNGMLRDVTEMKIAIARTRQAESRLKSALEGFSGPFALWDNRKRLIYWNRAFMRVFGLESTVRPGMGYDTIMLSQAANISERRPKHSDEMAEIIRIKDGDWYKIVERVTKSGGMITVGLNVTADVRNEVELTRQRGRLQKLVAELERSQAHTDELTQKLSEEKRKAERSANSKSAFLANMSHELRTPLNAINGFSEILVDEMYGPLGDERYKDYAKDILASGQHLLDMINDILDMAKIEAGKMTVDLRSIDVIDPVDAAVRMIRRKAEEKEIDLRLVANQDLPKVEADHRALKQMVLNLVSNAIKFTDEGGEIRVTIDEKGDDIRIAVRDNGIGIPEHALHRIGEPFEQVSDTRDRNYEGTGLGLALTKSFAEMHGGRLVIASEEGRGTQVSIFLPIPKPEPVTAETAA